MRVIILFLMIASLSMTVYAQSGAEHTDDYPVITAENAQQIAIITTVSSDNFSPAGFRQATQFAFHPDSQMLAVALDYSVGLIDVPTGEVIAVMENEGRARYRPLAMTFSQDGTLLVTAGDGGMIVWDVDERRIAFGGGTGDGNLDLNMMTISTDNAFFYIFIDHVYNSTVYMSVWDIKQQREIDRTEFCQPVLLNGDYALCNVFDTPEVDLVFMDLTTFDRSMFISINDADNWHFSDKFAFSPDKRILAFFPRIKGVGYAYYMLDLEQKTIVQETLENNQAGFRVDPPRDFIINSSGNLLIHPVEEELLLVDVLTGETLITFPSQVWWHSRYVQFSPDGRFLALGDFNDNTIDIYASAACYVTSDRDVNLRTGPGIEFDNPDVIEPGERLAVLDQQQEGAHTWYQLAIGLWVRDDVVEAHGDC